MQLAKAVYAPVSIQDVGERVAPPDAGAASPAAEGVATGTRRIAAIRADIYQTTMKHPQNSLAPQKIRDSATVTRQGTVRAQNPTGG